MHQRVYREFERILRERGAEGGVLTGDVLEIGAVPADESLLASPLLDGAASKVGLNLSGPASWSDFTILKGNANRMTAFEDGSFDVVVCNAVLEHDSRFWLSVVEMHRVLRPGGLLVVGTPGYRRLRGEGLRKRLKRWLRRWPGLARWSQRLDMLLSSTLTFEVHANPGDYYRFSRQAYREVILAGLEEVEVVSVLVPPRIIGSGRKGGAGGGR